ncbi:hypothetical protein GCM10023187_46790 [Nibrella viscosa]|uniref:Uncharacterized protein n=1 Tax=Nibrella viscosa TaxID=1084524 RepID=A0ABP8KU57_9BACT
MKTQITLPVALVIKRTTNILLNVEKPMDKLFAGCLSNQSDAAIWIDYADRQYGCGDGIYC